MNYTEPAKLRLRIAIDVMQRFGKEGTVIADRLLIETPVDSPGFDREEFLREVEKCLKEKAGLD